MTRTATTSAAIESASATPERTDGKEAVLTDLIGPMVYRKDIVELCGQYLAEYDTEHVEVELTAAEREEYEAERATYQCSVDRDHGDGSDELRAGLGPVEGQLRHCVEARYHRKGNRRFRVRTCRRMRSCPSSGRRRR